MIELNKIHSPEDLNNLSTRELKELAVQIRSFLLDNVSATGGHLSSNLGVVELTLALHKVFNSPEDKLIWDVGHQGYVHKILTGRQDAFKNLRQLDGMSGFLKSSESPHDVFDAGHSSTSISAAIGYAKAFKQQNKLNKVVAIIGDGALTGGMAFEALNYAGHSGENIIVVLNDNEMSISDNVGAMTTILSKARTTTTYDTIKFKLTKLLRMIPFIGKPIENFLRMLKNSVKQFFVKGMLFEELGFKYFGVIDGHNINKMIDILEHIKGVNGPILLHVSTKKGKGYEPAELEPESYHGVSKFDISEGVIPSVANKYQDVMGATLIKMASKHKDLFAITAAMPSGTGLTKFSLKYPDQFIDVGIAEQNAVTMATGMALAGMKPFVCIYSTFLQRAYDQIVHDVCLQNANVVFCIDRAGLVGEDGETHHGVFDIAYLGHIPHMTLWAPKDKYELEQMLYAAYSFEGPLAIRYPRGTAIEMSQTTFDLLPEILTEGDIAVVAVGKMVQIAYDAVLILKEEGIHCTLINPRQLMPMKNSLKELLQGYEQVVTIEDHVKRDGYGEYVASCLTTTVTSIALPDTFIEHGNVNELFIRYGLDKHGLADKIRNLRRHNG